MLTRPSGALILPCGPLTIVPSTVLIGALVLRPAVLLTAFLASPAVAQERGADPLLEQLRAMREADPDRFLADMTQRLFRLAPDGELTAGEADAIRRSDEAQRRADLLRQWLGFDLDGNFAIDASEVATLQTGLSGEPRATLEALLALADWDGDGAVSQEELQAHAEAEIERQRGRGSQEIAMVLAFDQDKDGGVTLEELRQGIAALASETNAEAAGSEAGAEPAICDLPAPSSEAEVVLLAQLRGEAYSTATLNGQDGYTGATRVVVEPGDMPLYVIAGSNLTTIWLFEGALDRVERVVAGSFRNNPAGVVNVPADRVSLQPIAACLPEWLNEPEGRQAEIAAGQLARVLGRESIEHRMAARTLDRVMIPTGVTVEEEELPDLFDQLFEATKGPDGIPLMPELSAVTNQAMLEIAPESVLSGAPVETYELLPNDAGLLQLLAAGALVPIGYRRFHVVEPFERFPAGLLNVMGGFVLAPGIPMPKGDPGSWVHSEETGECLTEDECGMGAGSDLLMWTSP